jgi:hypothetical protein
MAQQQTNNPSNINPTRYTERRAPQFIGGDTDPTSGNLITGTRQDAGGNTQPTPELAAPAPEITAAANYAPAPATPTTRLADIGSPPKSDNSALTGAAITAGAQALGKAFSSGNGGTGQPSASSSSYPNAGGFSTGGGSGNGGGSSSTPFVPESPATGYNGGFSGSSSVDEGGFSQAYAPAPTTAPAPSYSPPPSGGYDGGGGGYDSGGGGDDGGSGSVICTELNRQGLLDAAVFEGDQRFGMTVQTFHPEVYAGYLVWAQHVVPLMKRSPIATSAVHWVAAPVVRYMAIRSGQNGYPSIRGFITFHIGWALCAAIGGVMALWNSRTRTLRAPA